MQNTINITEERLNYILETIRNFILDYPYKKINNIIFINENAFYSYMENQKIYDNILLKEFINEIENCIPIILNDDIHKIFISAFYSKSQYETNKLYNLFKQECKINFLKEIRLIKSDFHWKKLVNLCQKLREENSNYNKNNIIL